MEIEKLDKNFVVAKEVDGFIEYTIPSAPFELYGVTYNEKHNGFQRLDPEVAQSVSDGVGALNWCTAGGRIRFATNSQKLTIRVTCGAACSMRHMPRTGSHGFTLVEDRNGEARLAGVLPPEYGVTEYTATANLSGEMSNYTLYFPLYHNVNSLVICIEKGAELKAGKPYRDIKPILYYGSSITQGGCSSRPDTCYQGMIEKWNNIDFINLGFSGNAKGEIEIAEYMANLDCSLFVCDYDHNAPNAEHLEATHYRLYKIFREKQPDTPIIFVSRPDYLRNIDDSEKRLKAIRDTYKRAKKEGDNNVYLINGKSLYGTTDADACAVDGCHPNDLGFYRMAKRIYREMKRIDKKFE